MRDQKENKSISVTTAQGKRRRVIARCNSFRKSMKSDFILVPVLLERPVIKTVENIIEALPNLMSVIHDDDVHPATSIEAIRRAKLVIMLQEERSTNSVISSGLVLDLFRKMKNNTHIGVTFEAARALLSISETNNIDVIAKTDGLLDFLCSYMLNYTLASHKMYALEILVNMVDFLSPKQKNDIWNHSAFLSAELCKDISILDVTVRLAYKLLDSKDPCCRIINFLWLGESCLDFVLETSADLSMMTNCMSVVFVFLKRWPNLLSDSLLAKIVAGTINIIREGEKKKCMPVAAAIIRTLTDTMIPGLSLDILRQGFLDVASTLLQDTHGKSSQIDTSCAIYNLLVDEEELVMNLVMVNPDVLKPFSILALSANHDVKVSASSMLLCLIRQGSDELISFIVEEHSGLRIAVDVLEKSTETELINLSLDALTKIFHTGERLGKRYANAVYISEDFHTLSNIDFTRFQKVTFILDTFFCGVEKTATAQ